MAKKKILVGIKQLKFFEITADTIGSYAVDTANGFGIDSIQKLTRNVKAQTTNIPADDDPMYDVLTQITPVDVSMEFAKLELAERAQLGFGAYDATSGEYSATLDSDGKTFAVSFVSQYNDNSYQMAKYFKFIPGSLSDSGLQSRDGQNYAKITLTGTFGARTIDSLSYQFRNTASNMLTSEELDWLESFEI